VGPALDLALHGVARTSLVPLCARAQAARLFPSTHFADPAAERIVERLGLDAPAIISDPMSILGFIARCKIFDRLVGEFMERHPDGGVLDLGSGLSTGFERQARKPAWWIDVDLPSAVALHADLATPSDHRQFVPGSVAEAGWLTSIDLPDGPVLIIAEGLLPYLPRAAIATLVRELADRVCDRPAEFVYDAFSFLMVGTARYHPAIGPLARADPSIEFVSGVRTRKDYVWGDTRWRLVDLEDVMEQLPPPVAAWSTVVETIFGVPVYAIAHLRLDGSPDSG